MTRLIDRLAKRAAGENAEKLSRRDSLRAAAGLLAAGAASGAGSMLLPAAAQADCFGQCDGPFHKCRSDMGELYWQEFAKCFPIFTHPDDLLNATTVAQVGICLAQNAYRQETEIDRCYRWHGACIAACNQNKPPPPVPTPPSPGGGSGGAGGSGGGSGGGSPNCTACGSACCDQNQDCCTYSAGSSEDPQVLNWCADKGTCPTQ